MSLLSSPTLIPIGASDETTLQIYTFFLNWKKKCHNQVPPQSVVLTITGYYHLLLMPSVPISHVMVFAIIWQKSMKISAIQIGLTRSPVSLTLEFFAKTSTSSLLFLLL